MIQDPPRPDPADLFEALARFTFEYPEIEPYLARVPAAAFFGGDATVARRALKRMDALIAGAVLTSPTWVNPALRSPAPSALASKTPPLVDRATWSYVVDSGQLPALRVTRSMAAGRCRLGPRSMAS